MERWQNVPGSDGKYQIDISTKKCRCRRVYKDGSTRELNQTIRNNRIYWCLTIAGIEKFKQAAWWVAITYPELVQNEYFQGAEIMHEDNDSLNNNPSNLKWGTHKENMNNPMTRKQHSDAMRGNSCHLGKKHSEEAKRKMSLAKKKREAE